MQQQTSYSHICEPYSSEYVTISLKKTDMIIMALK